MSIVYARLSIPLNNYDSATPASDRIQTDLVPLTAEGTKVIVSGVVLILLTALWTWMRLWSLRRSGRPFGVEDGFNLGAVALFCGLIATDFVMVLAGGMGHHMRELQDWHVARLLKALFTRQFMYAATLGLVKISVILMFMRIFFVNRYKLAAIVVMVFTIVWVFLTVLMELLLCRPMEMNWNSRTPGGTCGDQKAGLVAVGILDIINQLAILMLPLPVVLKVGMDMRYKIITACIFGIGILTVVFGTIRLCTVMQIDITDVSYTTVDTTVYGASEVGISIIVSSCPLLRPVFDRLLPTRLSGNSGWGEDGGEIKMLSRKRKSTKSSGFTQMENSSQEDLELELGNMGAHRAKRNTEVTVGKRPPSCDDDDDDSSVHRIVVTSETIVSRDKGEL
ncbi:hypothetical protein F4677DRAFT_449221 [Hypoxylon crocopeplum]|nr:hypothetical protein F4677DRAFT_449221 [Hypoxylon crocopeplum]